MGTRRTINEQGMDGIIRHGRVETTAFTMETQGKDGKTA